MDKEQLQIKKTLKSYQLSEKAVVSNFDGRVNEELEKKMKKKKIISEYPAWNFHGTIWYDFKKKEFRCAIMRYHSLIEILSGESILDIKEEACSKYRED